MKIVNERHAFVENHENVFPFLKENFGKNIEEGTVIKIDIKTADGENSTLEFEIKESDIPLFRNIEDFINQIA